MKKKSADEIQTLFQVAFVGEFVEIVAKFSQIYREEHDGHSYENTTPAVVKGYLNEYDDTYYYLGSEPNTVDRCIRVDEVSYIEVVDEGKELEKILDDFPVPEDKNESN